MSATRTRSPCLVQSLRATRAAPHQATTSTSATVMTGGPSRLNAARGVDAPSAGPDATVDQASAALTAATSIETPYTPNTLASCATGSTAAWLYPSSTQGNPVSREVRPSSVATH